MIMQVGLSAVPTEIKKTEDFRNWYTSEVIKNPYSPSNLTFLCP
jgi:hypothetical protein